MDFRPRVLAVGMNLLKEEVMDEGLVQSLENITIGHLNGCTHMGLRGENIVFNFSVDPSVMTPEIPVVFRISLLPSCRTDLTRLERDVVATKIERDFHRILYKRPNILVLVECLGAKQVGMSVPEEKE
ncbi:MAG: hypothetical protein A2359_02650 [Candidatus Moranbacteria bacterium RIFOXYB1_FULL_43_19]|nr:MAG: hypothetical protein A2359_02650 [Candidatus Moranbacteria bacterium RIFOXYB1_FULL_43_19]OGI28981.1 MAG: hypothetical protein A2184_03605 [Candidatus Moranbacteria bacterium RIFOXYA1_FULL_44_7]OGI33934.1 MAG: hypothetical protein A2420_03500 [Candidatus Moranbacteria bacterium RIFOXYC1_FULL_44_13]OGI37282.1 MAG: hypothetical protein A2612_04800 [Candidatus Moranbacteria bacterium RIFOXYD1_FULL_44_12]